MNMDYTKIWYILGIMVILILVKCSQIPETYIESEEELDWAEESMEEDTIKDSVLCQQDSVLKLADQAMQQLEFKKDLRRNMLSQIQQQLKNEKLTQNQIISLQKQSARYEKEIKEYHRRRVVRKDSIIYNITYKDTEICKPVYIPDTIYVEVLDTIKVKKLKKRKKR